MRTIRKGWPSCLTLVFLAGVCSTCTGGGGDDGVTNPPLLPCERNPDGPGCPTTGNIQVTVTGVPSAVPAPQIELTLADGTPQAVRNGSGTFQDLAPGRYTLIAQSVSNSPTVRHNPRLGQIDVILARRETLRVTFAYSAQTLGAIEFTVQGLPTGSVANFAIQGPSYGTQPLRQGINTMPHLVPGLWQISLPNVGTFVPQPRTFQVAVTPGVVASAPLITYTCVDAPSGAKCPRTGNVQVFVTGVPSDVPAPYIELDWFAVGHMVRDSVTFLNLEPGSYGLIPHPTGKDPTIAYYSTPDQANVTVALGQTLRVTFGYSAKPRGAIEFTVQGLPAGSAPILTYWGPSWSGSQPLREGANIVPHLEAGGFAIGLPNVGRYVPQPNTFSAAVTLGSITSGPTVTYTAR